MQPLSLRGVAILATTATIGAGSLTTVAQASSAASFSNNIVRTDRDLLDPAVVAALLALDLGILSVPDIVGSLSPALLGQLLLAANPTQLNTLLGGLNPTQLTNAVTSLLSAGTLDDLLTSMTSGQIGDVLATLSGGTLSSALGVLR